MYQYLNASNTAVLNTATRRCIYLDQPPTIHHDDYLEWMAEGFTTLPYVAPPAPPPATKAEMWERIKDERDRRKSGGFAVGALWLHSDDASRTQYNTLLITALEKSLSPAYVLDSAWKTMDGSFVPMTVSLLRQIRDVGIVTETALFQRAKEHKAAMEAAPIPGNYDFSSGWPATYTA